MKVTTTDIQGLAIIEPKVFKDSRGYFFESYSKKNIDEYIGDVNFVQENQSWSVGNVIRGLHFQAPPFAQAKLVRCLSGAVKDIVVDIRKGSPTYGKHFHILLSAENHLQLYIPKGFAHGYEVMTPEAAFHYMCDEYYHPEMEGGIYIFSKSLDIELSHSPEDVELSKKDSEYPDFLDFESPFIFGENC